MKWRNGPITSIPRLDFFVLEIQERGLPEYKEKADIIWYHDQRNEHYHGGGFSVPEKRTLDEIRQVAIWVFSVLFETANVEAKLATSISKSEEGIPSIPAIFVVPEGPRSIQASNDPTKAKALSIAAMIGKWDEGNEADREIIRRLSDGL